MNFPQPIREIDNTPHVTPQNLKQCFINLQRRKELILSPEVCQVILKTTFNIPLDVFDEVLRNVLIEFLPYLILKWPEWPSVYAAVGKRRLIELYSNFFGYLKKHLEEVIVNEKTYR